MLKSVIRRQFRLVSKSSIFTRSVVSGANEPKNNTINVNGTTIKKPEIKTLSGKTIDLNINEDGVYNIGEREKLESLNNSLSNSENLAIIIKNMIKTTGPISIANFMKQCLLDPKYGYYTTRNPLDAKTGDFITSPEISSTFGEICGLWFFSAFLTQLKHQATYNKENFKIKEKKFRLIEFGPGKGTLMYDMVRTLNKFVKNNNPIEIVFVEKSDVLINEQFEKLCDKNKVKLEKKDEFTYKSISRWGNEITWLKDDKPNLISDKNYMNFIMAHEFYDALPMNKFIKTEKGWREFLVDIRPDAKKDSLLTSTKTSTSDDLKEKNNAEFVITQAPYATPSSAIPKTTPRYDNLPINSEIEVSPESHSYMYEMAGIIKSGDIGAGLVIDYGTTTIPINSLRGIKDHKFVNPFIDVGEVDLSIDVDFSSLTQILQELKFETHVAEQGDFLNSMGLGYRIDQLMSKFVDDDVMKKKLIDSYKRLTNKGIRDMGKIYKVMGYYDSQYKDVQVPGFDKMERSEESEKPIK
jgi:SAM-dependent MidA family methyltransferase